MTARLTLAEEVAAGGPEQWTLRDVNGGVFAKLVIRRSSIRNGSRVQVCDSEGTIRQEVRFSCVSWSALERLQLLKSVCRGFDPPIEVANWTELEASV